MIVENKTLKFSDKDIELEHAVRKYLEYDNQIVVLIYDDAITANNVLCFDKQGTELWRINDILNIKRPTGNVDILKESADVLVVHSVLGIIFKIDMNKNDLIEKTFVK